eukprot:tig00021745_g23381.t1
MFASLASPAPISTRLASLVSTPLACRSKPASRTGVLRKSFFAHLPSRAAAPQRSMQTITAQMPDTSTSQKQAAPASKPNLDAIHFDNRVLRELFIDEEMSNYIRQVRGANFSRVHPTPVENPRLVASSSDALKLIDLDGADEADLAEFFSGNKVPEGAEPAAHCYVGYQFGSFAGQGDGAAMYLGEVVNGRGERWEIQMKGAGLTPYSRSADGRKVLRSSVREFLCSEAMHYLGVPTTRAGTVVTSDSRVTRDILYLRPTPRTAGPPHPLIPLLSSAASDRLYLPTNGNVIRERASVVLRIAPTFLRFGSFEIFLPADDARPTTPLPRGARSRYSRDPPALRAPALLLYLAPPPPPPFPPPFSLLTCGGQYTGRQGPSFGLEATMLPKMLDFTIASYYPEIHARHAAKGEAGRKEMVLDFYREVVERTARLAAHWQAVGWAHGVLNTDNMSILGVTIDYGPYGFLDAFSDDFVPNGSDDRGRYAYKNQPAVCKWNCAKLLRAGFFAPRPLPNSSSLPGAPPSPPPF